MSPTWSCPKCGAEFEYDPDRMFQTCSYCGSSLYVESGSVILHQVAMPSLNEKQATAAAHRWMASNTTAKDLEAHSTITQVTRLFLPLWRFLFETQEGNRDVIKPACTRWSAWLQALEPTIGNLTFLNTEQHQDLLLESPTNLDDPDRKKSNIKQCQLIHIPTYLIRYIYHGRPYEMMVDATAGRATALNYPHRDERPYHWVAIMGFCLFFIIGWNVHRAWIRLILYGFLAVPYAIVAYWTAKRA